MLEIELPANVEQRLTILAEKTGRSKSYYIRKAIEDFLEDEENYLLAVTSFHDANYFDDLHR